MSRTVPVLLLAVFVLLLLGLMRLGWRRRDARQTDLPALPPVPAGLGEPESAVPGIYVSSTTAGDWLDRIVAHGLGVKSEARVAVHPGGPVPGVGVLRQGAPSFFVPAAELTGVRLERGMAGKFVERNGLVVITWRLGDRLLDTGFRTRYAADRARLVTAVTGLIDTPDTPNSTESDQENA